MPTSRAAPSSSTWTSSPKGLLIPIEEAEHTPGALVFHFSSEPQEGGGRPSEAHVALSLGDGRTVEAQSEEVGVITDDNIGGRFEYAALLPGVDYSGAGASTETADLPAPAPDPGMGGVPDATGLTQDMVIYGIKMQESQGRLPGRQSDQHGLRCLPVHRRHLGRVRRLQPRR